MFGRHIINSCSALLLGALMTASPGLQAAEEGFPSAREAAEQPSGLLHLSAPAYRSGPAGGLVIPALSAPPEGGRPPGGNVLAFFLDEWGNLREDSNGNHILDQTASGGSGDLIIRFRRESDGRLVLQKGEDSGSNEVTAWSENEGSRPRPLWNAGELLAAFTDEQAVNSRSYGQAVRKNEQGLSGGRRIYSVFEERPPLGRRPDLELLNIEAGDKLADLLGPGFDPASSRRLIEHFLSRPQGARPEPGEEADSGPGAERNWRLGSPGSSKPVLVGPPSAAHHLIYGDLSYLEYLKARAGRRQLVYFGSGDGLFHAVNAGFASPDGRGQPAYSVQGPPEAPAHELGAEIWAFAPPLLLPNLPTLFDPRSEGEAAIQSAARPTANHRSFDEPWPRLGPGRPAADYLSPLVADVKDENGEWRTILIGVLRLGNNDDPVEAEVSEVFAFDVTDPEKEPLLLWSFRHKGLGRIQCRPALAVGQGRWRVLLASGPLPSGLETEAGIFVLDALSGRPEARLSSGTGGFFAAAFTVSAPDYLRSGPGETETAVWTNPAVYFSLNGGRNGGGVYRLALTDQGAAGRAPRPLEPKQWRLDPFFRSGRPVVGAVNAACDLLGNRWLVFATGDPEDASGKHYLYGVKESLNEWGYLDFQERSEEDLLDVSGIRVFSDGALDGAPSGALNFNWLYELMLDRDGSSGYRGYKRELNLSPLAPMDKAHCLSQPKIEALGQGRSLTAFTAFAPSGESFTSGRSVLQVVDTFTGLPAPYMKAYSRQMESGGEARTNGPEGVFEISGLIEAGPGLASEALILKTDRGTVIRNHSLDGRANSISIPPRFSLSSGPVAWREVLDMGFEISDDDLAAGIEALE